MDKSSSNLSYDSAVGADHDHSVETDAAFSRPPEMDPPEEEGTALPPETEAFIAECEPGLAKRCRDGAARILNNEKQSNAGRIDTGLQLIEHKRELGHGRFGTFIGTFDYEKKHAERCMSVARHFGPHCDLVSGVAWSGLCALTAKKVSQQLRDEVITRLKAGEHLTRKDIQSLISEASKALCRPVSKTDCPVLPQTTPSPSEKLPDSLPAVPDRSRAVALLALSDGSITGEANEFAVTMSDVQPPSDHKPNDAQPATAVVELQSPPPAITGPSQGQVDALLPIHAPSGALAMSVHPDCPFSGKGIQLAIANASTQTTDDVNRTTARAAENAVELIVGNLVRSEVLELGRWLERADDIEFMCCLRRRCGISEVNAHSTDDASGDRAGEANDA
ncbi:hypothetical protein ACRBEV_11445 [Methylobacterium phyllosphaerae]